MRLTRRLFSLFCCLLLGFCLVPAAYAEAPVETLPESACYCIDNGYLDFEPDGLWHGASVLTAEPFVNAVMAAFFPDSDLTGMDAADWLYGQGFVTKPELFRLRDDDAVNWIMAWRITQVLSGNWPMPAECFPEIKPQARCEGTYADARATAVKMGLATGREFAIARFRKADFADYLHRLMTGDYEPAGDFLKDLPGADLVDYERSVLTPGNYRAWNGYFKGYKNLPAEYLEKFRSSGWTVIFNPTYFGPGNQAIQGGLCSYGRKEIYLNRADERGLYHEFGHYVMSAAGIRSRLPAIFDAEAENMREILGDYSQTSADEYFAECVMYWIHTGDHGTLEEKSPGMYELISGLLGPGAGQEQDLGKGADAA